MDDIVTGEKSKCRFCKEKIGAVIDPYSGCVDWGSYFPGSTTPEDFGCDANPISGPDGCGSHDPGKGHTPIGFKVLIDSKTYWAKIDEAKRHDPIPADYPVRPIPEGIGEAPTTCGSCGLTWDDAVVTSMTPAPSARCPFEPFHVHQEV